MNKSLGNGVGYLLALFLFSVQSKSASSLHLKADLIQVRNARQAETGCMLPPYPANGRYSIFGANVAPGQTVAAFTIIEIECDFGYNATAPQAFCQLTNTWSNQWQCVRLEDGCLVPAAPENGSHELESKEILSPGRWVQDYTVLYYSCKTGYNLTATMSSICIDGGWSSNPKCERRIGCILPKMPNNGAYFIQNNDGEITPGSTVDDSTTLEFTCKKGFAVAKNTSVCKRTRWTSTPVCKKLCSKPESDSVRLECNPVMEDGCPFGSVIVPSCKAGYNSNRTLETMTCMGGTWNVPTPKCNLNPPAPTPTIVLRHKNEFQCALPNYHSHGKFTVSGPDKNLPPGTIVDEFTYITYSCDTDYDADASTGSLLACCEEGKWSIEPPICRERCPMVQSFSMDFTCYKSGSEMDCPKFLPYGSVITPSCKSGHEEHNDFLVDLRCGEDGKWDKPTPYCKTDCGLEKPIGEVQIVKGITAKKDNFPWHVGIYQWDETTNAITQICGGSIIHTNLVISAAHCFFDPVNLNQIDAKYYKVAAGKFLRSWDNDLPENTKLVQKSDVTEIYFHRRYRGDEHNQQSDLALLQLTTPFRFANSVRAVCYDINKEGFDRIQTQPGKLGKVAGWGRTENGEPSEELKTLELPVIDYEDCRKEMSKYHFNNFLTTDKLCAGHRNGSSMCQGDSGGGLVFPAQDKELNTRWYLRGVVSNGPLNDEKTSCRSDTYTAFTHIFKMKSWLRNTLINLRDTTQPAPIKRQI